MWPFGHTHTPYKPLWFIVMNRSYTVPVLQVRSQERCFTCREELGPVKVEWEAAAGAWPLPRSANERTAQDNW